MGKVFHGCRRLNSCVGVNIEKTLDVHYHRAKGTNLKDIHVRIGRIKSHFKAGNVMFAVAAILIGCLACSVEQTRGHAELINPRI